MGYAVLADVVESAFGSAYEDLERLRDEHFDDLTAREQVLVIALIDEIDTLAEKLEKQLLNLSKRVKPLIDSIDNRNDEE